ncbi:MAG: hypothetical protein V3U89_01495 [Methylophilaceae bacterium]
MQAIDITLKPSPLLLGVLGMISMLSCLVFLLLPLPFIIKLLLMAVVIFTTIYYTLRDALYLLPWSWQRVEVSGTGQLRLTNKRGQQFVPDLATASFIHPLLVILNTKKSALGHRPFELALPAVLLFSETGCQQHRQLRVWLRWWKHEVELAKA